MLNKNPLFWVLCFVEIMFTFGHVDNPSKLVDVNMVLLAFDDAEGVLTQEFELLNEEMDNYNLPNLAT